MKLLNEMVRNIVVYLLLMTIVMNLVGNSSYKKYIGIFTGMVLILMIARPVMTLLRMDVKFDYYALANQFSASSRTLDDMKEAEDSQKQLIVKEYEDTIKAQVAEIAAAFDYAVEGAELALSEEEGQYGKITGMKIWCEKKEKKKPSDDIEIRRIRIENIEVTRLQKELEGQKAKGIEIGKMKKKLADTYGIREEEVVILLTETEEE